MLSIPKSLQTAITIQGFKKQGTNVEVIDIDTQPSSSNAMSTFVLMNWAALMERAVRAQQSTGNDLHTSLTLSTATPIVQASISTILKSLSQGIPFEGFKKPEVHFEVMDADTKPSPANTVSTIVLQPNTSSVGRTIEVSKPDPPVSTELGFFHPVAVQPVAIVEKASSQEQKAEGISNEASKEEHKNQDTDETFNSAPKDGHQQLEPTDTVLSTDVYDQRALSSQDLDLFEYAIGRDTHGPVDSVAQTQGNNGNLIDLLDSPCVGVWHIESRGILGNTNHPCTVSPPMASPQVINYPPCPVIGPVENLLPGMPGPQQPRPSATPVSNAAEGQLSKLLSDLKLPAEVPGRQEERAKPKASSGAAPAVRKNKEETSASDPSRGSSSRLPPIPLPKSPSTKTVKPPKPDKPGQEWAKLLAYSVVHVKKRSIGALSTKETTEYGLLRDRGILKALAVLSGKVDKRRGRLRHGGPTAPLNAETRLMSHALNDESGLVPSPPPALTNPVPGPAKCAQESATVETKSSASVAKMKKPSQPPATPVSKQAPPVATVKDDKIPDMSSKAPSVLAEKVTVKSNVEPPPNAPSTVHVPSASNGDDPIVNAAATKVSTPDKKCKVKLNVGPPPSVPTATQAPPAVKAQDDTIPDTSRSNPSAPGEKPHVSINMNETPCGPTTAQASPTAIASGNPGPDVKATNPTKSARKPLFKPMKPREPAAEQNPPLREEQTAPITEASPATKPTSEAPAPAATNILSSRQDQVQPTSTVPDTLPETPSAPATEPVPELQVQQETRAPTADQAPSSLTAGDATMPDVEEAPVPTRRFKLKLNVGPPPSAPTTAEAPLTATVQNAPTADVEEISPRPPPRPCKLKLTQKPRAPTVEQVPAAATVDDTQKADVEETPVPTIPSEITSNVEPPPSVPITEEVPLTATVQDAPTADVEEITPPPPRPCKLKLTQKPRPSAPTTDSPVTDQAQIPMPAPITFAKYTGPPTPQTAEIDPARLELPPALWRMPTRSIPYFGHDFERKSKQRRVSKRLDMMDYIYDIDSDDGVDPDGDVKMTNGGCDSGYASSEGPYVHPWLNGNMDIDVVTKSDEVPMDIDDF
ncbi:MAG: hypothetical protein Q9224_004633 [Gallowayella concinna]